MKVPEVLTSTRGKFYCLFSTCKHVDCSHREYIVTTFEGTLEEAKTEFPEVNFCEDWEAK